MSPNVFFGVAPPSPGHLPFSNPDYASVAPTPKVPDQTPPMLRCPFVNATSASFSLVCSRYAGTFVFWGLLKIPDGQASFRPSGTSYVLERPVCR